MNQNQLKDILVQIAPEAEPFEVIFSGKDGGRNASTYNAKNAQIVIHNKKRMHYVKNNVIQSGIKELAHHLLRDGKRRKTAAFLNTYHNLLSRAKISGRWKDPAEDVRICGLLDTAKALHMELAKVQDELGGALSQLYYHCTEDFIDFDDIVMRSLLMRPCDAKLYMRIYSDSISREHGAQAAMELARETNLTKRDEKEKHIKDGHTLQQIKQQVKNPSSSETPDSRDALAEKLQAKYRLEGRIKKMKEQIQSLDNEIKKMQEAC